jgi:hypothetical protein
MSTMNRVCEACGEGFWQGRGRPAKRCPPCRAEGHEGRYGPAHRALRAATIDQAFGQLCSRCRLPMVEGQALELDHADGGGPGEYAGWSHAGCNRSAGASRGNAMRAAAYRAAMGLPTRAPARNGARPVRPRPAEPPPCQRTREEITAEAKSTGKGLPCLCGRTTSRCW